MSYSYPRRTMDISIDMICAFFVLHAEISVISRFSRCFIGRQPSGRVPGFVLTCLPMDITIRYEMSNSCLPRKIFFFPRGSVVDLAVGVISGGAFGNAVSSLVNDIIMPPLVLILGRADFAISPSSCPADILRVWPRPRPPAPPLRVKIY